MRVVLTALVFCAVSFVAGVAGDLSVSAAPERAPPSARVELPPYLANAVRAGPLPSTRSAEAAPIVRAERAVPRVAHKPRDGSEKAARKGDSGRAAKPVRVKA